MLWWVKVSKEVKWRKRDGRQTRNGSGWEREGGRKVSRAVLEREGRAWWAPNEQIMTGSILQDGVNPPPPSSLLLSSLLSLTVQFPPLASLLLPANCEWSLIIGPPTRLRSEVSQCLREETGMSKCYLRQQTARETEVTHNKTGRSSECTGTSAAPLTAHTDKKTRKRCRHKISFINTRFNFDFFYYPICKCVKETISTCFLASRQWSETLAAAKDNWVPAVNQIQSLENTSITPGAIKLWLQWILF